MKISLLGWDQHGIWQQTRQALDLSLYVTPCGRSDTQRRVGQSPQPDVSIDSVTIARDSIGPTSLPRSCGCFLKSILHNETNIEVTLAVLVDPVKSSAR